MKFPGQNTDALMTSLESLADADLLDAWVRDECRDAMDTLVRRYAVMVLSVCQRRCRSHADAQDAMQTTFLYLAKSAASIKHPECLAGWLHRVAHRASVATLDSPCLTTQPMIDVPAEPEDPLQRLTQRHEAIVLDEELADLPDRYRSAILLHLVEGQTFAKVADRLGTTTGAVRGYVQRGKKILARRLRHRGVVPVLAFSAVKAWTCESAAASQHAGNICDRLVDATSGGDLPDFSTLESLLGKGTSVMSVSYKACLLGLTACVLAVAAIADGIPLNNGSAVMTLPANQDGDVVVALAQGMMANPRSNPSIQANSGGSEGMEDDMGMGMEMGGGGGMGMGGMMAAASTRSSPVFPRSIVTIPKDPNSTTAKHLVAQLDDPIDIRFQGTLDRFTDVLSENIDAEVFIDSRTLRGLKLEPRTLLMNVEAGPASNLRSVLRLSLQPHGLRAVIEDDGLVITADWAEQTSRGVSTDRWLDVRPERDEPFKRALDSKVSVDFFDLRLIEIANELSQKVDIPIQVDVRALDEVGLSIDTTFNISLKDVSLRSALELMLETEDLTYSRANEVLMITSKEAANNYRRTRAYFLDDIVGSRDVADFSSMTSMLQTTVQPDTWEALGGPSTMFPITSFGREKRSVLIVSSSESVHHQIKMMLDNLRRESVVEPKPPRSPTRQPVRTKPKESKKKDSPSPASDPFGSSPFEPANAGDPFVSGSSPF